MSYYISVRGRLESCLFDSKRRAEQHAISIAIACDIPLTDVYVIQATSQRDAENKSAKHFGS